MPHRIGRGGEDEVAGGPDMNPKRLLDGFDPAVRDGPRELFRAFISIHM